MSDCSGDNRLIDYSDEYKEELSVYVQGRPLAEHGIFSGAFPDAKLVRRINFDPPVEG